MLGISGFGHVSLTVSHLDRSANWYERVLGLTRVADIDKQVWRKVIFEDPASKVVLSLTHHGENGSSDVATEFRTGLDHLSFVVPSRVELDAWLSRLDEHDVPHTDLLETSTGWVLVFRDPDNIQLELYAARDAVDADYEPTEKWRNRFPPVRPPRAEARADPPKDGHVVSEVVKYSITDGVGLVVMRDVAEGNVLTRQIVDETVAAHDALVDAGARVAILTAEGPAWCSGGDFKTKRPPGVAPAALELFSTLNTSPIVWIAAVNAPALGVGIHLATTCLRVLVAEEAWMRVPDWAEGRFPGPLTAGLARIVGHRRALWLVTTGERVSAAECVRIGLADAVAPAADLLHVAQQHARALLAAGESALDGARAVWTAHLEGT